MEEYDDKLDNIISLSILQDDYYELASDFHRFVLKYRFKESAINNKFDYALKNNETDEEFYHNFNESIINKEKNDQQ